MNNNNIYNQILNNFSEGKYSYNDYLKIKSWFSNIHDHKEAKQFLWEHWSELNRQQLPEKKSLQHVYEHIEYKVLLDERSEAKQKRLWIFFRQVAALLLIMVSGILLFYYFNSSREATNPWVEINSPYSSRTQFFLPDGSKGWLNSGSKLKYNPVFKRSREVELIGEAYFDILHDNSVFIVSTVDLDVEVLGTSFNVSSYPDEDFTEVVLVDGKVEVKGKTGIFEKELKPDQKLCFIPDDSRYNIMQVDPDLYTAWKDGFLRMDNETLEQATDRIQRWYNVEIMIKDEELRNYRFKATFQDEPLEEVLRLIAMTTPMEYIIKERETGADGIYQKKRVILRLKN